MPVDERRFRDALGRFPTGVAVITTVAEEGAWLGMTVSSFNSVSLSPPLVLFSIARNAASFPAWTKARQFAVNILSEDQEQLSNRFARSRGEKWIGLAPLRGKLGLPLLPNTLAAFECETYGRYDGGDHEIIVGEVKCLHEGRASPVRPLVFHGGRYRRLSDHGSAHAPPSDAVYLHGW